MGAVQQLLRQVRWGELDILVLDLPPGTGDTQLSLTQNAPLNGAVIVSTPQDLALADAIRGINMFNVVNVPVLGIIENMSFYCCPSCGHIDNIFGDSGAENVAKNKGISFLGKVPLHSSIRETTDKGTPIVVSAPTSEYAKIFVQIAKELTQQTSFN